MRSIILLACSLALAGCSRQAPADTNQTNTASPLPKVEVAAPPAYIGRWAANAGLCADGAWRFEELSLSTAGEVACDFRRVTEVAGGYDVDATCHAEGTDTVEVIELRVADGRKMSVRSKTFQPIDLVRCEGERK